MADAMIGELVAAGIMDNQEVKDLTFEIALMCLKDARKTLRIGVPQERTAVTRLFIPFIARTVAANTASEDEAITQMRKAMAELLAEVRGDAQVAT